MVKFHKINIIKFDYIFFYNTNILQNKFLNKNISLFPVIIEYKNLLLYLKKILF